MYVDRGMLCCMQRKIRVKQKRDQQVLCTIPSVPRAMRKGPAIPAGTTVMVDHWKA